MQYPLVSVLIPAYNHEKFVRDTLLSVLEQDYPNLELLVLDDGSTDNTFEILTSLKPAFKKKFKRVEVSTQQNAGTAQTLSRLVDRCHGKYIIVCASDDIMLPDCIQKQVAMLEAEDSLVQTLPDNIFIAPDGKRLERIKNKNNAYAPWGSNSTNYATFAAFWKAEMPGHDFSSPEFHSYEFLLKKHNFLNGSVWRAQTVKKFFPLPACRMTEDYFINLQLAKSGHIKFVNKPLFAYRIHSGQTVKNKKLIHEGEQNLFTEELKQVSKPGQEKWKQLLKNIWFSFHTKRWGFSWCYIEHRFSYVCSQRILGLFGKEIIYHTRYKFNIPTGWK